MKHEIRSLKYLPETNSTRVVACPEGGTASDSTERTIHHSSDATHQEREQEIEAWVASLDQESADDYDTTPERLSDLKD